MQDASLALAEPPEAGDELRGLHYPFGRWIPEAGKLHPVADGVFWLRMPLPFALDHINLWLLDDRVEGRDGLALVDCGASTEATRAAWEQLFAGAMARQTLLRVFATHCHPDHVGLSGWLCERFKAPFWTSAAEFGFARMMAAALPGVDGQRHPRHGRRQHGFAPRTDEDVQPLPLPPPRAARILAKRGAPANRIVPPPGAGRPYGAGHAHSQERRGRSDGTIPPHAHLHRPRRHPSRLPRRW